MVDRQVDRIERRVAHDDQALIFRPAEDALPVAVDEVQLALCIDNAAGDRIEAAFKLVDLAQRRRRLALRAAVVEHGELAFAHIELVGHVADRVLVGELAGAQIGGAAGIVAAGKAALAVHVHITKTDVAGIGDQDCGRHRLVRTRHAVAVVVREQDVLRVADFDRYGVGPVAHFFLGLRCQKFPVLHLVQHDLGADVVLGRELVDLAGRRRIGDVEAGLRIAAGRPDARERTAAAVGHPDARILTVPVRGGVEAGVLLVRVSAAAVVQARTVAALDAHIVHQRLFTRAPQQGHGAVVDFTGGQAQARDDAVTTARAFQQRLRAADALVLRRAIRNHQLRQARMQRDEHRVRLHADRVVDDVEAQRQVDGVLAVDGFLERRRVVGAAVALRTEVQHIGPVVRRRQCAQCACGRRGGRQRRRLVVGRELAWLAHLLDKQAVVEFLHQVIAALAGQRPATVAKAHERRHVAGAGVFHADLRVHIVLVADDERGAADILEAHILAPQPVAITAVDLHAHRRVADVDIDQREARLMLADRGVALAIEGRIEQRELPGGRGLLAQDAVAATVKAQVVGHVADLINARQARADMEIDVAQVRVLRRVHAHGGGGRIAVLDLEVDVRQRRIEGR